MTLLEITRVLDSLDDESTIYASEPWTENSEAILVLEPESGCLPVDSQHYEMKYFLEVFVVRQFLEGWVRNLGAEPTLEDKCARLIKYAITDA